MCAISIKLADEELDHLSQGGSNYGPRLAKILDEEMSRFDSWMLQELGGSLIPLEKSMLKTYLYHKIVGRVDGLPTKAANPVETLIPVA